MALSHVTKVYAIKAAKISPLLTDVSASAATYGTSVPLTGCKGVKVTGTVNSVDLWGDNTYLDSDSMLKSIDVELDYAKLNIDALVVMLGGVAADTGTTPNFITTWNLPNQPVFPYFKVEGQAFGTDTVGGDLHIVLAKVKLADFPQLGLAEENYQMFNIKCKAVTPIGSSPWFSLVNEAVAVPIA